MKDHFDDSDNHTYSINTSGGVSFFPCSWLPDSRSKTYSRGLSLKNAEAMVKELEKYYDSVHVIKE